MSEESEKKIFIVKKELQALSNEGMVEGPGGVCFSPDTSGRSFSPDGSLSSDVSEQCLCPDGLAPDAPGGFCLWMCQGGVCLWAVFLV